MWEKIFMIAISIVGVSTLCNAQTRYEERSAHPTSVSATQIENPFAGKWTYRSYHNKPEIIVDKDAKLALSLIFGEGILTVDKTDTKILKASFDMGGGSLLDLEGTVQWQTDASPTIFNFSGKGRPGTPTEDWQYDYAGYLTWVWPNGASQVPAIVGTVIRVKPHGEAKAGYVASFIATKRP